MGIHHCWSKNKATSSNLSDGDAGDEPFEAFGSINGHITNSWVDGTIEDAFETTGTSDGRNIYWCVGDNVKDEIVDFNNGQSNGAGSAASIYGECGGERIRINGVHDSHFHHIHISVMVRLLTVTTASFGF